MNELIHVIHQIINETNISDELKIQLTSGLLELIANDTQGKNLELKDILWDLHTGYTALLMDILNEKQIFNNPHAQNALLDVPFHITLQNRWDEYIQMAYEGELEELDDDEEYDFEDFVSNEGSDILDRFIEEIDENTLTLGVLSTLTQVCVYEDYQVVLDAIMNMKR